MSWYNLTCQRQPGDISERGMKPHACCGAPFSTVLRLLQAETSLQATTEELGTSLSFETCSFNFGMFSGAGIVA